MAKDTKTPRERELEGILEGVQRRRYRERAEAAAAAHPIEIAVIGGPMGDDEGDETMAAKCGDHVMVLREIDNLKERDNNIETHSISRDDRIEEKVAGLSDKIDRLGLKMAGWGGGLLAISILAQLFFRYILPVANSAPAATP
jgi:hypothetical protein